MALVLAFLVLVPNQQVCQKREREHNLST
uniref:Uncharacterized protein n=1 Tax=Anguilla anguilla TaxID=7936 RepID=A0A0E9U0K2_ANGAN